jgi:hypothetical protein
MRTAEGQDTSRLHDESNQQLSSTWNFVCDLLDISGNFIFPARYTRRMHSLLGSRTFHEL